MKYDADPFSANIKLQEIEISDGLLDNKKLTSARRISVAPMMDWTDYLGLVS